MTRGKKEPPIVRLLDKTRFDTGTGCWEWIANVNPNGYASFPVPGVGSQAHRVAYLLLAGAIPEGLHLDHVCRNKLCVNPDHLEPVTQAENNRRAGAAKTHCVHGHEYTRANTYRRRNGRRECGACARSRANTRYATTRSAKGAVA